MQEHGRKDMPKRPLKARHIVLFSIAILLLIGSLALVLAGAIGWTALLEQELQAIENAEPMIPGGDGLAMVAYVFVWIFGIFALLVLLALCWLVGLILSVILAFFMKKKPVWLSVLSYILFAIYTILMMCILIPVIPGLLILLFLILFG